MNYNDLLEEKMKNFYAFIMKIVPHEKQNKLQSYEKMKENISVLLVFMNVNTIDTNINLFTTYFDIILNNKNYDKFKEYMLLFHDIRQKIFENNETNEID